MRSTSDTFIFTNTPTSLTRRVATARGNLLRLLQGDAARACGIEVQAQHRPAPSSTAASASSTRVMPQILISTGLIDFCSSAPAIQRSAASGSPAAHQRLTDEESLVSRRLEALDVSPRAQAALGHQGRAGWSQFGHAQRGFQIDLESFQIAIVDADERGTQSRGALQLLGGVHFDQRVEMNEVGRIEQLQGVGIGQSGDDHQHGFGSGDGGFIDLVAIDEEILAQQRQASRRQRRGADRRASP